VSFQILEILVLALLVIELDDTGKLQVEMDIQEALLNIRVTFHIGKDTGHLVT
jgi:hypothetical protein